MTVDSRFLNDSPQRLAYSCEYRVGLTRYTENTIQEGLDSLVEKSFKYLITNIVDSITIYSSLDASYRVADLVVSDTFGIREIAPLVGNEIISVAYKNAITDGQSKEKIIHFRILNIEETKKNEGVLTGRKTLLIKLVEFPAFHFLTSTEIYKTYPIDENNTPKLSFSDMIQDMLTSIPYFSKWYDVDVEKTKKNNINFFIPNWIPLRFVNFCKKYSVSEKNNYPYYVFHIGNEANVDKPKLFYKSVFNFIDRADVYRAYSTTFQDITKISRKSNDRLKYGILDTLDSYRFKYFDAMSTLYMSGDVNVSFDYLNDNKYIGKDYKTFILNKYKAINPYTIYPLTYGNNWSTFTKSSWNSRETDILIPDEIDNEYTKAIFKGGIKCEATCPIYEGRNPGERAELIFNSGSDETLKYDKMFSGAWLTWEIVDHIVTTSSTMGQSYSNVTFINDSYVDINDQTNTMKRINTISIQQSPIEVK